MARNKSFRPAREPMRDEEDLHLIHDKIHGAFSFLNPTQAHFTHADFVPKASGGSQASSDGENEKPAKETQPTEQKERIKEGKQQGGIHASSIEYKWTSRNNRKGRHALVVHPDENHPDYLVPLPTSGLKQVLHNFWLMATYYPVWDVSFLVAFIFTWGSVIWVINACFALLPLTNPSTAFPKETLYGGGITAFIGATVFELGSILLMFEAVNENRSGCFGYALEKLYDDTVRVSSSKEACIHHHQNRKNFVGKPSRPGTVDTTPHGSSSWVWFPSWHELTTHYFHDLGFLACSAQMFGATVFWISGFTALPGIYTVLNTNAKLNGAYWAPQIIGGSGFVMSGILFTLETQKHWWQPAPKVLGWHIAMWNFIGGMGFMLCGVFGLFPNQHWAGFQASCSTFWGSWAFLIGSTIQWYESVDKHPVEAVKNP